MRPDREGSQRADGVNEVEEGPARPQAPLLLDHLPERRSMRTQAFLERRELLVPRAYAMRSRTPFARRFAAKPTGVPLRVIMLDERKLSGDNPPITLKGQ